MNDVKREWFEKDFYATLGVDKTATAKEITSAYRKLARQYHPDANPDDASAEERFKEISAAYDVLGDDDRRRQYDQTRRLGPMGGGGNPFGGFQMDGADLGDLLGGLFNAAGSGGLFGGAGGRGPGATMRNRAGADQEAQLTLTFDEALEGITTEFEVAAPGHATRTMKMRIPSGVEDGQRIRLRGKGAPGSPPGDLIVTVSVGEHRHFARSGANLTLDLPVTFAEAALGADVKVPTHSGESVTLRIPAGTQSGRTFRVKGHGATTTKKTGDLLVTVEVAVPAKLSPKQRTALQAFADLSDQSPRDHLET